MSKIIRLIYLRFSKYIIATSAFNVGVALADVPPPPPPAVSASVEANNVEAISPKALHEFSALLPAGAKRPLKEHPVTHQPTTPPPTIKDAHLPVPKDEEVKKSEDAAKTTPDEDKEGVKAPQKEIIRVVGHPFQQTTTDNQKPFVPFPSTNTNVVSLSNSTRPFGSQALPIGGGQFSPYLSNENDRPRLPEPTLFPRSFGDWMQQENVLGDWGGLRSRLHKIGIDIGGRWLGEAAGNPMGGRSHKARAADEEAFTIDVSLKQLTGWNLGIVHFMAIVRQGENLADTLPLLDGPMEIAGGGEHTHLGRLSWEMNWNKYVSTEIGDINVEKDFAQSSTYWGANLYCQFQNNGICGMPQSLAMNTNGYSWYPTALPGAWIKIYPGGNDHYLLSTGVYSVEPYVYKSRNSWRISTHHTTGIFVPVQIGWHRGGQSDYHGDLQTNIKLGAYWDSSKVSDVFSQMNKFNSTTTITSVDPNPNRSAKVRGRYGMWAQADQMIQRDKKDPSRGTAIFGTFEWGDPETSVAPYFITFGAVRKGTFKSRPNDTISFGGKVLWVNHKLTHLAHQLQRISPRAGILAPSTETTIELNYGYRPAPWLLIRPGAQYAWSPGGTNRYKNAFILGMESQVIF